MAWEDNCGSREELGTESETESKPGLTDSITESAVTTEGTVVKEAAAPPAAGQPTPTSDSVSSVSPATPDSGGPEAAEAKPAEAVASPVQPDAAAHLAESAAGISEGGEGGESMETMETMTPPPITRGTIVAGRVLSINDSEVLVDVGLKSEAAVPRVEFVNALGELTVAPGDAIDVWVDHFDETTGTISVSHQRAVQFKAWERVEQAFHEQTTVRGRVVERIKGGLVVDFGIRGFLPGSHADVRPHVNLDALKGQEIECKVVKLNRKRNNLVVSRRLVLEEQLQKRRAALKEQLKEGAVLTGRVKNLTDYGAFVDLGGMDGLLHVTDLSWRRIKHPSEVVQADQEVRVKVLKFDAERGRVSLGLKQLAPDPWEHALTCYRPGQRVKGRVVSLTDFGAFVELEPGVEGLIHISEMSWSRRLRHPSKILHLEDMVEVVILEVDAAQRRISLSLKQALPDPWYALAERFSVGSVVQGRVRNLTDFGAFVEIEDGVDGLIHLSNLSWTKNTKHPSEVLKKGQKVEAVVLSLDSANRRLSLGIKQLQPDVWEDFFASTQVGDVVRGKVVRMASFGAFVELREGIEGLCHLSEIEENHARGGKAQLSVGSEHDFRVIRLNPAEKRIGLSLKEVARPPAPAERDKPKKEVGPPSTMAVALSSAGVTVEEAPAAATAGEQKS
jgi:small subunit ribosomal protein S1